MSHKQQNLERHQSKATHNIPKKLNEVNGELLHSDNGFQKAMQSHSQKA